MGARIVGILFAVLIVVAAVYGYRHYQQQKSDESGTVHCVGCMSDEDEARYKRENAGESVDGQSEHKLSHAQQAANDKTTAEQDATAATPQGMAPQAQASAAQSQGAVPTEGAQQNNTQPVQPQAGYAMANTSATGAPPMTDSQSANAPNGMRFSGSGTYQWYRQGNLTWRTDTASGRSCIVYATLEEWRKQIVLSHGCGQTT